MNDTWSKGSVHAGRPVCIYCPGRVRHRPGTLCRTRDANERAAKKAERAFAAAASAAGWPYDAGRREYYCPHGVGHGGIHGCDGCCGKLMTKTRERKPAKGRS